MSGVPLFPPTDPHLAAQIGFVLEIDRLKGVVRRNLVADASRRENTAEHSWHLAMLATTLSEHAATDVDVARVTRMLLIHDLVEIDAGDTFYYDSVAELDQGDREQKGADRIFGLLPADQGAELRALWEEFEARETPDALFAKAIDRFQPCLLNFHTEGGTWREYDLTLTEVLAKQGSTIEDGSPTLWAYTRELLAEAVERGYLRP
ncbi:HD domain-containing protein [Streptomyces sp. SID3343]|uniref:HD domain-containing protein n=1 Tax=Streptomyces sp. SID3343 TaxID=2690260 RepID=UPI00136EAD17|nr:HD domain-containing protein [Streptomyces sp. SID3343]MYV97050.1 HD domain-containing protein [Streptomyces sp. SID3343]